MTDILIDIDEIGDNIKFSCKLSQSYITFVNYPNFIFSEETELNWNQPKLVLILLKYSFGKINKKYNKPFRYYVSTDEIQYMDLEKWKVIEHDDKVYLLECELKDAFYNIVEALVK